MHYLDMGMLPTYVGFAPDETSWNKEMKRLKMSEEYPKTDGRCTVFENSSGKTIVIITINKRSEVTQAQVAGLVAHEAVHAFDFICKDIGETDPSSEFKAYTIQHITQFVLEKIC